MSTPRIVNRNGPTELEHVLFENDHLKGELLKLGESVSERSVIGNAQAIYFAGPEKIIGESDPRGEGSAQGY